MNTQKGSYIEGEEEEEERSVHMQQFLKGFGQILTRWNKLLEHTAN